MNCALRPLLAGRRHDDRVGPRHARHRLDPLLIQLRRAEPGADERLAQRLVQRRFSRAVERQRDTYSVIGAELRRAARPLRRRRGESTISASGRGRRIGGRERPLLGCQVGVGRPLHQRQVGNAADGALHRPRRPCAGRRARLAQRPPGVLLPARLDRRRCEASIAARDDTPGRIDDGDAARRPAASAWR